MVTCFLCGFFWSNWEKMEKFSIFCLGCECEMWYICKLISVAFEMCLNFWSYCCECDVCVSVYVKNCRHIGRTSRDELAAINAKLTMLRILDGQLKTTELINSTSDLLATYFAWCKRNEHWSLSISIPLFLFLAIYYHLLTHKSRDVVRMGQTKIDPNADQHRFNHKSNGQNA